MRSTSVKVSVSTALVVLVLSAVPVEARQQRVNTPAARESQSVRVVRMIREAMARTFGTIAQALPTIPIPGPTATINDEERLASQPVLPVDDEK